MTNVVALIAATVVLILIPGPNVALIVANSLRHGLKSGLITTLGTTAGIAIQLFLVIAGMAVVIEFAASSSERASDWHSQGAISDDLNIAKCNYFQQGCIYYLSNH